MSLQSGEINEKIKIILLQKMKLIKKTQLLKLEQELVDWKQVYLQVIYSKCMKS